MLFRVERCAPEMIFSLWWHLELKSILKWIFIQNTKYYLHTHYTKTNLTDFVLNLVLKQKLHSRHELRGFISAHRTLSKP